jgi:TonB-dependent SusC/RagA subfamily outer membrane receptor
MKNNLIILLLLNLLYTVATAQAPGTAFKKKWAAIDSLIAVKDLPKTALQQVNQLYREAVSQKNEAEIIKALVYRNGLENRVQETPVNQTVADLEKQIGEAFSVPQKSILQVILADTYLSYFQQQRWQLYNRSRTSGYQKQDISTWNTADFYNRIAALYQEALQPADVLQHTLLDKYAPVIIPGNTRKLRPTLFDLLAHKALDFFQSADLFAVQLNQSTHFSDPAAFAPAAAFVSHTFSTTSGTDSVALQTLQLFQSLLAFHANDTDPAALADADIARISWVYDQSVHADKKQLYTAALQQLATAYQGSAAAQQVWYLQAALLVNEAGTYDPFGDTSNRYGKVQAKAIIDRHLDTTGGLNEGSSQMLQLRESITEQSLFVQAENVNSPALPFRAYVRYQNTDTLYGRIIRVAAGSSTENVYNQDFWEKATSLRPLRQFVQPLPATHDYQTHATEIKIDALPPGQYLFIGSCKPGFNSRTDIMTAQYFAVSALSYIHNGKDYFVLDRESGQPLAQVKAQISTTQWDNNNRRQVQRTLETLTTDKNGYFRTGDYGNTVQGIRITLARAQDTLGLQSADYIPFTNQPRLLTGEDQEKKNAQIFFFTDRSIYRPGQTVYFKGIAITKDSTNHPHCYRGKDSIRIFLRDANNQLADSLSFLPNSYGSFAGRFRLPQNTLTGTFSIQAGDISGQAELSVEEYKRPSFYISFDTLSTSYKLNDSIVVTGQVKAYAGNTIGNAPVSFRVSRSTRFPYPLLRGIYSFYPLPSKNITSGLVTTDAQGRFSIRFAAAPDSSVSRKTAPVFDFSVNASVTDNNGETREGSTRLSVAYHSLVVKLDIPAMAQTDSFTQLNIVTQNLSGKNVPADVQVAIYPLQAPGRLLRNRFWRAPDQFVLDEPSFIQYFPHDVYRNENDVHNWPRKQASLSTTFHTTQDRLPLNNLHLEPGCYAVEARLYNNGDTIKEVQYIQLYQAGKQPPVPVYNWTYQQEDSNNKNIVLGSSAPDVYVVYYSPTAEQEDKTQYRFTRFSNSTIRLEAQQMPALFYAYVKHNRFYKGGGNLPLATDDHALQISYTSFRDKTTPGSREKWTVTVSGSKGEKAAAELLTSMYDASLDQFKPHEWQLPAFWQGTVYYNNWNSSQNFSAGYGNNNWISKPGFVYDKRYDQLLTDIREILPQSRNGDVVVMGYGNNKARRKTLAAAAAPMQENAVAAPALEGKAAGLQAADATAELKLRGATANAGATPLYVVDGVIVNDISQLSQEDIASVTILKDADAVALYGSRAANGVMVITTKAAQQPVQVRKNFDETAFFFPQLYADSSGNYSFSFTMPDAVTQWKWMSLAHTQNLAAGIRQQQVVSQKTLMVQPNTPRFVRNGDRMELTAKITNLSSTELSGQAQLQLIDAGTNQPVDGLFQNVFPSQYFTAAAGQSAAVKFPVSIPYNYNQPVILRVSAKAGNYSDGEEHELPVLSNRTLVTETLPLLVKAGSTRQFSFDKLLQTQSGTLTQQGLTVEFTGNPAWYAIQALPFLAEKKDECADQVFNRLYANLLAASIVQRQPGIQALFAQWSKDSSPLQSKLQQNETLKQLLLQETPWVLDAQNEAQQKKNIALLFNTTTTTAAATAAVEQLQQMQLAEGGFPWFKGGTADTYITNYILTGIGRLQAIHALPAAVNSKLQNITQKAVRYIDRVFAEQYKNTKPGVNTKIAPISPSELQYLFMRSYYRDMAPENKTAYNYYYQQMKKNWAAQTPYNKALTGLVLYRNNEKQFVRSNILPSVLENAVTDSTLGMYWKNRITYFWHPSPVEHQSMLLLFALELNSDQPAAKLTNAIDQMRTWLLFNKQTHNWKTTAATADACYVLLAGNNTLSSQVKPERITLGSYSLPLDADSSGYLQQHIDGTKVVPDMGHITIATATAGKAGEPATAWGTVYWQYFENNDKITAAGGPLSVERKLFVETNSSNGPVLTPVADGAELKVGDKVKIRIEIKSSRDLEYVHLKDARAANMEPVNVLSGYRWQDGLGYYESTRDAASHFFISALRKGTYVFEYPAYVTHGGSFNAGIATIQCMYAPEISAHSDGIHINVTAQ